jgi:hypothetical protein
MVQYFSREPAKVNFTVLNGEPAYVSVKVLNGEPVYVSVTVLNGELYAGSPLKYCTIDVC